MPIGRSEKVPRSEKIWAQKSPAENLARLSLRNAQLLLTSDYSQARALGDTAIIRAYARHDSFTRRLRSDRESCGSRASGNSYTRRHRGQGLVTRERDGRTTGGRGLVEFYGAG